MLMKMQMFLLPDMSAYLQLMRQITRMHIVITRVELGLLAVTIAMQTLVRLSL